MLLETHEGAILCSICALLIYMCYLITVAADPGGFGLMKTGAFGEIKKTLGLIHSFHLN